LQATFNATLLPFETAYFAATAAGDRTSCRGCHACAIMPQHTVVTLAMHATRCCSTQQSLCYWPGAGHALPQAAYMGGTHSVQLHEHYRVGRPGMALSHPLLLPSCAQQSEASKLAVPAQFFFGGTPFGEAATQHPQTKSYAQVDLKSMRGMPPARMQGLAGSLLLLCRHGRAELQCPRPQHGNRHGCIHPGQRLGGQRRSAARWLLLHACMLLTMPRLGKHIESTWCTLQRRALACPLR
jgi:hypothetical protein